LSNMDNRKKAGKIKLFCTQNDSHTRRLYVNPEDKTA
jgi:hypothetical protein